MVGAFAVGNVLESVDYNCHNCGTLRMPLIPCSFPLLVLYLCTSSLDTSIDTKIVSWPVFFSMKLINSVVSLIKVCCFCAIGCSNP